MSQTDLERTGSFIRDNDSSNMRVDSARVNLPQWLFIYLIAQLIGSIWWAATLQSDVRYLQAENVKVWQKVETQELQLEQLDRTVRRAVREAMEDAGYVRVHGTRDTTNEKER